MDMDSHLLLMIFLFVVLAADTSNCFVVLCGPGWGKKSRRYHRQRRRLVRINHSLNMGIDNKSTMPSNISDEKDSIIADDNDTLSNLGRRERRRVLARLDRKNAWLAKYGSSDALKQTFGTLGNKLSPSDTRALYHALLPRSLLALSELDVLTPEDLAPMAYKARIAAKEYARSQCNTQGRILTALVDQYRNIKRGNGLLSTKENPSMTWDDVWEKYEKQIMEEERHKLEGDNAKEATIDEEELMMQIYMRILEKSCATNEAFDGIFLKDDDDDEGEDEGEDVLAAISSQLEEDIRSILLSKKEAAIIERRKSEMEKERMKAIEKEEKQRSKTMKKEEKERIKAFKKVQCLKRKLEKRRKKLNESDD